MQKKNRCAKLINTRAMFTKERDGGNMNKTVEKIVINSEGIDVISNTNGVNNVTQLSLEAQGNEIQQIFQKYNLETGVIYHYDEKIIRALEENRDQLIDYIETCRRASYPAKKVDVPETIPEIEYDLRGLKGSFQDIEDENLRKMKQIEMYNKAKEVHNMFKGRAIMKMGIFDRAYFSVQELLQNRSSKTEVLLLGDGIKDKRAEFRKSLHIETETKETHDNQIENEAKESEVKTSEEKEQDEELAI